MLAVRAIIYGNEREETTAVAAATVYLGPRCSHNARIKYLFGGTSTRYSATDAVFDDVECAINMKAAAREN